MEKINKNPHLLHCVQVHALAVSLYQPVPPSQVVEMFAFHLDPVPSGSHRSWDHRGLIVDEAYPFLSTYRGVTTQINSRKCIYVGFLKNVLYFSPLPIKSCPWPAVMTQPQSSRTSTLVFSRGAPIGMEDAALKSGHK